VGTAEAEPRFAVQLEGSDAPRTTEFAFDHRGAPAPACGSLRASGRAFRAVHSPPVRLATYTYNLDKASVHQIEIRAPPSRIPEFAVRRIELEHAASRAAYYDGRWLDYVADAIQFLSLFLPVSRRVRSTSSSSLQASPSREQSHTMRASLCLFQLCFHRFRPSPPPACS